MAQFRKTARRILLGVATASAVAAFGVYWFGPEAGPVDASADSRAETPSPTAQTARTDNAGLKTVAASSLMATVPSTGMSEAEHNRKMRDQDYRDYWHERIDHFRDQGGNVQQFFAQLNAQCGGEPDLCLALLNDRLAGYPDAALVQQLRAILEKMHAYEAAMAATVMSSAQSPQERYQTIDALRVNFFGEASAELLYGQERAWADYQFGYEHLLEQAAPNMAPGQRLAELDNLKRDAWGEYYEPLSQQENASARYQQEKQLLLIGVTDQAQQQAIAESLRQKHFDEERARLVAEQEARSAEQQAQRATYAQAKQALQREMNALQSSMPEGDWQRLYQSRLEALRREVW